MRRNGLRGRRGNNNGEAQTNLNSHTFGVPDPPRGARRRPARQNPPPPPPPPAQPMPAWFALLPALFIAVVLPFIATRPPPALVPVAPPAPPAAQPAAPNAAVPLAAQPVANQDQSHKGGNENGVGGNHPEPDEGGGPEGQGDHNDENGGNDSRPKDGADADGHRNVEGAGDGTNEPVNERQEPELEQQGKAPGNKALDENANSATNGALLQGHDPGNEKQATPEGAQQTTSRKRRSEESTPDPERASMGSRKRPKASDRNSRSRDSKDGPESSPMASADDDGESSSSEATEALDNDWETEWSLVYGQLKARSGTERQQTQFKKLFRRVDKLTDELSKEVPNPPGYFDPPAAYIKEFSKALKKEAFAWCDRTFADGLNRTEGWRAHQQILKQQTMMEDDYNKGFWPWPLKDTDGSKTDAKDLQDWARRLGVDIDTGDGEGTWSLHGILGEGGFGYAALWIKRNSNNTIIKKIVIKYVCVSGKDWLDRSSPSSWYNSVRQMPTEASFMTKLKGLAESHNIVELIEWDIKEKQHMYCLYQEYCPHGSLGDMIEMHAKRDARISPHVLWEVFEALASAACLMANGKLPLNPPPQGGWRSIVHSDIKPNNIFLSDPLPAGKDVQSWPGLPVPKLGDFGVSHHDEVETTGGTKNYAAPERDGESDLAEDTVQSDIWTIARVILAMMELDPHANKDPYDKELPRIFQEDTAKFYDPKCEALMDLIEDCLLNQPDNRPDAVKLWNRIWTEISAYRSPREPPLRLTSVPDEFEVLYGNEKYPKTFD